jgi:hypothetical protein
VPKLTDTQAILLSTAAQRTDDSLLPPPDTLGIITHRIRKAVETLVKRTLAGEVEVTGPDRAWRSDGDLHWGAVITDAGRAAIGVEPAEAAIPPQAAADQHAEPAFASNEARQTKAALVLTLLRRDEGATLAELVSATKWLPHTTRAALTGLRKKGHNIAKGKRDEVTCYAIAVAA